MTFSIMAFFLKSNFKAFKIVKMPLFDHLKSDKIDFTQCHNGRKIAKFPHCGLSTIKIPNQTARVCISNQALLITRYIPFMPIYSFQCESSQLLVASFCRFAQTQKIKVRETEHGLFCTFSSISNNFFSTNLYPFYFFY